LIAIQSLGQDPGWQPVYENYTVADGLPSMECYYSCEDHQGYMWFATDRGAVRYNGSEFVVFTVEDGLESNVIFKIVPDDKGRVWFLSDTPRLCYYENGKIISYKYNDRYEKNFHTPSINSYTSWLFKNDEVIISTMLNDPIKINKDGHISYPMPLDTKKFHFYETDGVLVNNNYEKFFEGHVHKVYDFTKLNFIIESKSVLREDSASFFF
jgi:hypothetical protein